MIVLPLTDAGAAMKDRPSFFFTGATVLPAFLLLNNVIPIEIAMFFFMALLFAGILTSIADETSPARQGVEARPEDERKRR